MALTRLQSAFVYQSGIPGQLYTFTIALDQSNQVTVQSIQTPWGSLWGGLCGAGPSLPESVIDDIQTAIGQVENLLAQTSAVNGTATFAAETYQDVAFPTAMVSTSYRVLFSVSDFVAVRVTNKTLSGFRIEVGSVYTGSIGYDVFI